MMSWTYLVIVLALVLYYATIVLCGRARGKYGVPAPATAGNVGFECAYRVQMNTLEHLVPFLPALYLFSRLINPMLGAVLGGIWLLGRLLYVIGYVPDKPGRRAPGFAISVIALIALTLGAGWGAIKGIMIGV
jgi:uncharacterized membrane protein YecN with MAPEG domain